MPSSSKARQSSPCSDFPPPATFRHRLATLLASQMPSDRAEKLAELLEQQCLGDEGRSITLPQPEHRIDLLLGGSDDSDESLPDSPSPRVDRKHSPPPPPPTPPKIQAMSSQPLPPRPLEELKLIYASEHAATELSDDELLVLLNRGAVKHRELEAKLRNNTRAVALRRHHILPELQDDSLPYRHYDYTPVTGACCENVVGYVPVPAGIAGPLLVDGEMFRVPMATTEGALIASTNRGCAVIREAGGSGVQTRITDDGMTRAPVLRFDRAAGAVDAAKWINDPLNRPAIQAAFQKDSRYLRLVEINTYVDGALLFVHFKGTTGDAMGMNMISKGANEAIKYIVSQRPGARVISLSGNMCSDKKAAHINWLFGRGKSVVADVVIPAAIVERLLHTTVDDLVEMCSAKMGRGSSNAGTVGGSNAHAANIVAAIFIATGQDVAQVVSSSMCSTIMEKTNGGALQMSCTMRCLEVGTHGGGTILPAQRQCLEILDCAGPSRTEPGAHACQLARIIAATVLAGELSLSAALCNDELVKSHMKLNRSQVVLHDGAAQRPESGKVVGFL